MLQMFLMLLGFSFTQLQIGANLLNTQTSASFHSNGFSIFDTTQCNYFIISVLFIIEKVVVFFLFEIGDNKVPAKMET